MKIRTDFVTNSSSSSFCIEVGVELTSGEQITFTATGIDSDGGDIISPYMEMDVKEFKKAKNIKELIELLRKSVHFAAVEDIDPEDLFDEDPESFDFEIRDPREILDDFEKRLRKAANSLDDVKKAMIAEIGYSEGDQTDFDVECDIFDSINAIAKIYPNLNRDNYASFPNLLSDVERILSGTETLKDNDPEEFVLDYMDSFANAPFEDERTGFDPYKSIKYHAFDFENNRIIHKRMAFSGYGQVFSDNLASKTYKERLNFNPGPSGDTIVTVAKIRLSATSRGRLYDYICNIDNVSVGDNVIVEGQEGSYTVLDMEKKAVRDLDLPFNYYKKVISKI